MTQKRDYYEVLGLSKGASADEIKRAYKKKAREFHPDVNKSSDAEAKFKEVNEAYQVLGDPEKKATYDQFGHDGLNGQAGFGQGGFSGFGGFEDIFDMFGGFGGGQRRSNTGPRKGQDRYMQMNIEFMEAVFGKKETITLNVDEQCSHCSGSGAETPSDIHTCRTCNGTGRQTTQQRTVFGTIESQTVCSTCHGKGQTITKKCHICKGEGYQNKRVEVDINIPAGVQSGQQLRVSGKGERGINNGPNGDLFIDIQVKPHKIFNREGSNIYIKIPISVVDATLGTKKDIPTVEGDVSLTIPEGTQHGTKFRLKGKGVNNLRTNQKGDQIVEVDVKVDSSLSKDERRLYEQLRDTDKKKESPFDKFIKNFKN